jgi:hypothetical protein
MVRLPVRLGDVLDAWALSAISTKPGVTRSARFAWFCISFTSNTINLEGHNVEYEKGLKNEHPISD